MDDIKREISGGDEQMWGQKCIDVPGLSQGFFVCNQQLSMTRVLREVKRCEHSVSNCIASIVHDVGFVRRVHEQYGFPLCGNKRCGAWYTGYSPENDTCYFKSTDGHVNQWSFSMARLNLHVAMYAIEKGGCIIVDATRRGKRFPDALSKTVPIWAAVVNTCVLIYQMDNCLPLMDDTVDFLCLPEWVPEQERFEIEKRIDVWATQLSETGVEWISRLASKMTKPLRCCWVHPSEKSEIDIQMEYPMLVLVSASLYGSRERKQLQIGDCSEAIVYEYVAGAGDDEESWARGLTPSIMWNHYEEILQSEDSSSLISALVSRSRQHPAHEQDSLVLGSTITWFGQTKLAVAPTSYISQSSCSAEECYAYVNLSDVDFAEHLGCGETVLQKSHAVCGGGMTVKDAHIICITEKSPLTRLVWIHDVIKKNIVVQCAPAAIEFASLHLCQGRSVIFVYDGPLSSVAVGLVLGTIIACFDLPEREQWHRTSTYSIHSSSIQAAHRPFTRDVFKTYVAKTVAQYCPHIVVSKSILKQVFNLFYSFR